MEQARQVLSDSEADIAELSGVISDSEAYLQQLPPDSEYREQLIGAIAQAKLRLQQLQEIRSNTEKTLTNLQARLLENPDRDTLDNVLLTLQHGGQSIGQYLPGPWREILVLIGLGAGGIYRFKARKTEQAATTIVDSINAVKEKNSGVVDFNKPEVKEALRAAQNKAAQELVAQRKIKSKNTTLPEA